MTRGWVRASNAPWSEAHFDLDPVALGVHRPGHPQPRLRIELDHIRRVVQLGPFDRDHVEVEITTTAGAVLHARWTPGFGNLVIDSLRQTLDRPPGPPPVPGTAALAAGPFPGVPKVGLPDLREASLATLPVHRRVGHAPSRRRHHRARWSAVALLVLAGLVTTDLVAIHARIERVEAELPAADDGVRTWLLVGSDSRAAASGLPLPETFGTTDEVPGERADVILVVQEGTGDEPPRVLSVPRDLLVFRRGHGVDRLALSLLDGPSGLILSVCRSLGVAVDHLVKVRFDGLRQLVDAVGGVEVHADHRTRDLHTGLDLPEGPNHLDGAAAIAWMRSRHQEHLVDGSWTGDPRADGGRQGHQREVLDQLTSRMASRARNPLEAHRLAWTTAGAVSTDGATGPVDLARLALTLRSASRWESLPHDLTDGHIPVATLTPPAQDTLDGLRTGLSDGPPCPRPRIDS